MCGIGGYLVNSKDYFKGEEKLQVLRRGISHRGPDSSGIYSDDDNGVHLVHTRLAIIDLSESADQPMRSKCGNFVICFNGEIYNYIEIKAELEKCGIKFVTASDTEVALEAYIAWGTDCFARFKGMFAISLYDRVEKKVVIARDQVGIKPVFFFKKNSTFAFCSEIDPLVSLDHFKVSQMGLVKYLRYRYISGRETIWDGIGKLGPGEYLSFSLDTFELEISRYHSWCVSAGAPISNLSEAQEEFDSILSEVMKRQSRSDVPLGIFLSGGTDSSLIAEASRYNEMPLQAFTLGFDGVDDEIEDAQNFARSLGFSFNSCSLSAANLDTHLSINSQLYGNPLADSSSVAYTRLSEFSSKSVKVAFGGDGGDECFGGYKWYLANQVSNWIPPIGFLRRAESYSNFAMLQSMPIRALSRARGQERFDEFHGVGFYGSNGLTDHFQIDQKHLLQGGYNGSIPAYISDRLYDLNTFTADGILYKVDVASMRYGLEVRVPLLDVDLVAWSLALNQSLIRKGMDGKLLVREHMAGKGHRFKSNRHKRGFSLPLKFWEKNIRTLSARKLKNGYLLGFGILPSQLIEGLLSEKSDLRSLWTVLNLEYWARNRKDFL